MQGTILLNYDENLKQVEQEEQSKFIKNLVEQMGVPPIDGWDDSLLSPSIRKEIKKTLQDYNILVIDDNDGSISVYVDKELVGVWQKCTYKLKRDFSELDRKKQLFLEMEINYWTVFEDETPALEDNNE